MKTKTRQNRLAVTAGMEERHRRLWTSKEAIIEHIGEAKRDLLISNNTKHSVDLAETNPKKCIIHFVAKT